MAGRKRTATAIHEARGTFEHDPQRRNHAEPKAPRGFPEMPDVVAVCPVASDKFRQVCGFLDEMKILHTTDVDVIASYANTYAGWKAAWMEYRDTGFTIEGQFGPKTNPVMSQLHALASMLLKLAAEMGLTPSSRTRLHADKSEEVDPLLEYLKKKAPTN